MFVVNNTNTKTVVCFSNNEELWKALPDIVDDSDSMLTFIYEGEIGEPMKDVTRDYLVIVEKE